jgi:hypothetical protein
MEDGARCRWALGAFWRTRGNALDHVLTGVRMPKYGEGRHDRCALGNSDPGFLQKGTAWIAMPVMKDSQIRCAANAHQHESDDTSMGG